MSCISCRTPKTSSECGVCREGVCKKCQQFLDAGTFTFLSKLPDELAHTYYCPSCFAAHVEPAQESYAETMERARGAFVFFTTQKARIPLIKKGRERIAVAECTDRDETILRLAFQAAELGFNAIVETEVVSKKVRNEGYQKTAWSGVAFPAQVDEVKMESSFWSG